MYYPGQFIVHHETSSDLIVMKTGTFGMLYWKPGSTMNGTVVQQFTLEEGSPILLTTNLLNIRSEPINYDVQALKYTYGLTISTEKLFEMLQNHYLDYSFFMSVYNLHLKDKDAYAYSPCEFCDGDRHNRFECTKLHYIPSKTEVVWKHVYSEGEPARREYEPRHKGLNSHIYYMRKALFGPIEKSNRLPREDFEGEQEEFEIDQAEQFPMFSK